MLGTVYKQGNLQFTADGNSIISPVGNRVAVFDLLKYALYYLSCFLMLIHARSNKSRTLPFENRKNIARIALSPDSNVLLSVDEGTWILSGCQETSS